MIFQESKIQEIKNNFPSICHSCDNARRPASDANTEKGYVGCTAKVYDWSWYVAQSKEVAEGWVDLRANIFSESSGLITNYQMLTLMTKKCDKYDFKTLNK